MHRNGSAGGASRSVSGLITNTRISSAFNRGRAGDRSYSCWWISPLPTIVAFNISHNTFGADAAPRPHGDR